MSPSFAFGYCRDAGELGSAISGTHPRPIMMSNPCRNTAVPTTAFSCFQRVFVAFHFLLRASRQQQHGSRALIVSLICHSCANILMWPARAVGACAFVISSQSVGGVSKFASRILRRSVVWFTNYTVPTYFHVYQGNNVHLFLDYFILSSCYPLLFLFIVLIGA